MEDAGIRPDQVSYVRGFADRRLKNPANPLDPSNRRVSVVVQYQNTAPDVEIPKPAHHAENPNSAASEKPGPGAKSGENSPPQAKH
jgi:chemotaxis protein MotB